LFTVTATLACPAALGQTGAASAPPAAVAIIAPGENLTVEGVPPIPASLAEEVGRYTEFRAATLADWHPARRELLIRTRFGDTAQVHRVERPGGDRSQLTFFPDTVGAASYQPERGDYFVFSKDVGGSEFTQNYRYDLSTGAVTLLTDGRSRNSFGVWSRKGDRRAYASTRRNGRDYDIYVVDPRDPKSDRLVKQVEGSWGVSDWSSDDRKLLLVESFSNVETRLWLLDLASGQMTDLTGRGAYYGGGQFTPDGPDGRGIYTTTDRGSEFRRLTYIDLATRTARPVSADIPWDVEDFDLSEDGRLLAFVTNEAGAGVLHVRDTRTGRDRPVPRLPLGTVGGLDWRGDTHELGFVMNSARAPSDVYSLDTDKGRLERWTRSETGGLPTERFVEPTLVRWKSFDGREISGFLYQPPTGRFPGKRPVMVSIHGGPESQSRPGFLARNNYYLNELGVALLYPNIRGSSGYGKTFLALDNGTKREDAYEDLRTLFDWIGTQPGLDGGKIMVTGGSYGGHSTLAVATRYPDKIACALDVVGMSSLVTFLERTEAYRRDNRRAEYGDERDPKTREWMEKTAPLNNAARVTRPLFVVQGRNDPRVPHTEALQMVERVRKNGTPVWFLMASDEGHGFAKKKNADYQFYATVQFIRQYLLK
jgi:dipeptidyl aminopeptidase/acylaminoacyl peptidase